MKPSDLSQAPLALTVHNLQMRLQALKDLQDLPAYRELEHFLGEYLAQSRRQAEAATEPLVAFRYSRESAAIVRCMSALDTMIVSIESTLKREDERNA